MVKKSNIGIKPFITRVQRPYQLIDMETLENCIEGLRKRIKLVRNKEKRSRLMMIKQEIQSLINSL